MRSSSDVNAYLKEITGKEITAKDFRTWAGTVMTAIALSRMGRFDSAAQAKRNLRTAIAGVAARMGNTPTICRECYVHPEVLRAYLDGDLALDVVEDERGRGDAVGELTPEETAVLAILRDGPATGADGKSWHRHRPRAPHLR